MFKSSNNKETKRHLIALIVFFSILPSMSLAEEGWTVKTAMPTARWELSTCTVNGKIYAIGGHGGGQRYSIVEEYDPTTDTWTRKADMPTARALLSTSVVNGKIYAISGAGNGGPTTTVEEYDPVTDTWTRKADIPKRAAPGTAVVDGRIYAIGSWSGSSVQIYDPVTDTWTAGTDSPIPRQDAAVSVVDGKIYAIGGQMNTFPWSVLSVVEEYDPAMDTWTRRSDMPTARDALCTAVADGIIYAIGGYEDYSGMDITNALLSTVEAYDPATDTWIEKPGMPTPRSGLSASTVGQMIYAIGGQPGRWPAVTDAVEAYSTGPWGFASNPSPLDGALHLDTWVALKWTAGDFAVSHDVYFSDNFDDVNTGTAEAFQSNQSESFFIVGFAGFPYPDGLVPGTTYYWRIDEINDLHPESPWMGSVWRFTIPPRKAYDPFPSDGAESVDLNVELSWSAGLGATMHTVYFGDDFDEVNNGTDGIQQVTTSYIPGPLQPAKTYYWRVDEFTGGRDNEMHKGDVWSFSTMSALGNPNP